MGGNFRRVVPLILLTAACPVGGSLGRRERRYLLAALPMLAAGLLAMVTPFAVVGAAEVLYRTRLDDLLTNPWFLWSTAAAGMLAYLISAARFQLMFPAIAVDDRTITFRTSLKLTRGNTIAIFLGSLVASAPLLVPSLGWWLPEDEPAGLARAAANGLDYLTSIVSAVVVAGFCAQLYARQFGTVASVFE